MKRITLPFIRNILETTNRLLQPHGITVAHKPTKTLQKILSNPKDPVAQEAKTVVIYNIQCTDCSSHYVGQTGRRLAERIHEHQLAVRRQDESCLISQPMDRINHTFNWETVSILNQAKSKNAREFLKAWHSDKAAINRHTEVNNIYIPFIRDNRKAKRAEHPLASNQHADMQRLTPGSALEEQLNSTIEPNEGTINSIKQQTTAQSRKGMAEDEMVR